MSNPKCSTCKTKMKKNGKTKAGMQRYAADKQERNDSAPYRYGSGIDWNEFHMPTEYRQ